MGAFAELTRWDFFNGPTVPSFRAPGRRVRKRGKGATRGDSGLETKRPSEKNVFVTFVNPFCVIRRDDEADYAASIDDINRNTYDHADLCRIVTSVPRHDKPDSKLLVCGDGAIALPMDFRRVQINEVVDIMNGVMCSLLLGGHHCEAIDSRDVVWGAILEDRAIWPTDFGNSLNAHRHSLLRMKLASNIDSIILSQPRNIRVGHFSKCYEKGGMILRALPHMSPTFLLRAATEMRYDNLTDGLSNLWIVTEQLTEVLWQKRFLGAAEFHPDPDCPKRKQSLDEDSRTWSISVKQEILFQKAVIPEKTYRGIYIARKARNDLVHTGHSPDKDVVKELFSGVIDLICIATGVDLPEFRTIDLSSEFRR